MQVIKGGSGIGVTSRLPTLWLVVLWFTTIVLTIAVEVHFGFEQFVMTALKLGGAMVAASLALAPLATLILALQVWSRTRSHAAEMRERAVAQQRAHALANVDPLTGLLNRRGMAEELAACAVISEQRAKAVALLVVDLDHFKFVNDVHGHLAGDDLIRQFADRITARVLKRQLSPGWVGTSSQSHSLMSPTFRW